MADPAIANSRSGEGRHSDEPRRILVIRFSSLGDVVLVTPVLRVLRDHFPEAHIDLATRAEFAGLMSGGIGRLINAIQPLGRDQPLMSYLRALRQNRYDLVVDLHRTLRSRVVFFGVRAGRRLAYDKRALRRRLLVAFGVRSAGAAAVPELYAAPLRRLGIGAAVPGAELHPSPRGIDEVEVLLRERGAGGRPLLIALAPGAKWSTKRWPAGRYGELAAMLISRYGALVAVVGDEGDRQLGAGVAAIAPGVLDATGRLSLEGTAALIGRCSMFVGNDSGLMHVAAALGVPVVAMFGPTVLDFGFGPWTPKARVIETTLSCRPCSTHGTNSCPLGHHRCMRDLSASAVEAAVAQLWPAERSGP